MFSINAVAPLFAVLLLGYVLKRINFLNDAFISVGNKVVFYVALPASLFMSVYSVDVGGLLDWRFATFVVSASIIGFVSIWFISSFFIKDKKILGAFTQGAFRGNFVFLGMPLLINIAGAIGEVRAALIMAFVLPVYNICAVLLLASCSDSDSDKKVDIRAIIYSILTNPFIIAIFLALSLQLLDINLPFVIERTIRYPANMATALALICLGAGMNFQGFDKRFKYALIASMIKVILMPVVFVAVGYAVGFRDYDIAAILILGGIPSAIAGYVMVVQMGGDGYIASTIVVISTFLSAFTLTLYIYILRIINLI